MRCNAPFSDDDPMLPSGSPPIGRCRVCGDVHRLDLGCPAGDISRGTVVAWGCRQCPVRRRLRDRLVGGGTVKHDPHMEAAIQAALLQSPGIPKKQALRAIAVELARVAQLTCERANQFQTEAGHPERFLVAVDEASGDSRPPLRILTPNGG